MRKFLLGVVAIWNLAVLIPLVGQQPAGEPLADLVITGGEIQTLNPDQPTADWLAVRGDRIAAVGTGDGFRTWLGSQTKHLQLPGEAFVTPGFIESHGHFLGLGQAKMMLDLSAARSWEEIIAQVAAEVQRVEPGAVILGRGWHQEKWDTPPQPQIDGYPTHQALSAISPNNPVILTHASGHMCFANEYAMRLAHVTPETKNPTGGEILRLSDDRPSGVFRETAQGLLSRASGSEGGSSPEQRRKNLERAAELATEECWKFGITSFHDAGSGFETVAFFRELADQEKLGVRLNVMIRASTAQLERGLASARTTGYADHFLTVRSIKISIDGALGPHGAWLLLPYEDMPTSVGLNTVPVEEVERGAALALQHDYQLCVHAIGDKANQVVLDIYEQAFQAHPAANGPARRWRIEHAQHLHPDDIARFGKLGVIAAMQGNHCTSDAVYVIQRLGLRRAETGAYVWRRLIDSGAVISNGTDVPVEPIDPLVSFYASVTRRLRGGRTFFPEQAMTREEALKSYTWNGAYAAFEEDQKGSLLPGKLADITIWSHNLLTCPEEQILQAKVRATIVGGQVKYSAD